ncbi:uncharacterized protein LOC132547906 [Ylistrum balloti]|uniref:uncharacterized protein LOC132547906 n=1 Tax=Ylistrum balloti TaxID=509963 RepID=UPI002905ED6C|nr:uncharacterized protein LOC132547906 [Ylistrum balloti]
MVATKWIAEICQRDCRERITNFASGIAVTYHKFASEIAVTYHKFASEIAVTYHKFASEIAVTYHKFASEIAVTYHKFASEIGVMYHKFASEIAGNVSHMASHSRNENGDFEQTLLNEGVSQSTLERLRKEAITDWSTLTILTPEDISELGLPVGQKAIVRKLIQRKPPDNNGQTTRGLQVRSNFHDKEREAVLSETATEYAGANTFSREQRSKKHSGKTPVPLPQAFNKTTTNELPPRKSREQRSPHGVHFPEDMLAPDPDDDMYEAPVATNGKHSVMNVRHNSIPDEEAPDVPLRQRSKPKTQRSLSEGETTMRVVKIKEDNTGDHEVELNVSCLETDGKGKIILELTTAHQDVVKPLPARILLLVDTSGSMGIKVGRTRRSKLNRLKAFVMSMVKILDDGDQAALVTFGEDTKVLLPMTEINDRTQDTLTRQLDALDKTFLSQKTDLSAGLITSLDVFGRVCKSQNDLLSYRNSIIVFSDGEINMGTQEPQRLVHEVREKIRSMSFGLDNTQNQWVSISTVVTGSSPSEIMYSLSKFCSSDAFYHLDTDKSSKSDVDLFLPIMMRKTAIAWNVSLHVASLNGATIINADCTQENKVRLRGHKMAEGEKTEKAYFFYDIQAASEKHVGIVIDLSGVSENPDVVVLTATIHFTGVSGKRRYVTRDVTLGDLTTNDQSKKKEALEDIYMHEARILSQVAVSKAAEELKTGRAEKSRTRLIEGQTDLQRLMESYGQMAEVEEVKIDITPHAESVIKNLQSLLDAIESATGNDEDVNGKNWIRMKAVSSAITREAPTTSDTVADNDILCPLPKVRQVSSENIREQMVHVYRKQGVRNSSFINMDHTMKELSASLRMRPISE